MSPLILAAAMALYGTGMGGLRMICRQPPSRSRLTDRECTYRNDLRWAQQQIRASRRGRRGVSRRVKYRA